MIYTYVGQSQMTEQNESGWISCMREFHTRTGNYRQRDVQRLLGAPWERVEIKVTPENAPASCVGGEWNKAAL